MEIIGTDAAPPPQGHYSQAIAHTIYLASIADWARVNVVYERLLGDHRPAPGVVPTGTLHRGFGIGMMAVAGTYDQANQGRSGLGCTTQRGTSPT